MNHWVELVFDTEEKRNPEMTYLSHSYQLRLSVRRPGFFRDRPLRETDLGLPLGDKSIARRLFRDL